jgi:hypothetical protein
MRPEELAGLAQTAFNARSDAGMLALWTDDFHFVGPDGESHGAQAMLAREHNLWRAFPDITATIRNICVGEDVVVFETTMVGTNTGPLRLGRNEVAPTGKQMTLVISVHMWFRDGLGSGERVFYDRLGMLRQLGLPLS